MSVRRRFLVQALALFVTTMAAAAETKTPNRAIDGFLDSGNYGPKAIVRRWMQESPGRYWMAYAGFLAGVILCLFFNMIRGGYHLRFHNTNGRVDTPAEPPAEPPDEPGLDDENLQGLMLAMQSAILALCLMYVAVIGDTLADLTVTYLVGLCEMQIMVDTIRVSIVESGDRVLSYLALVPFASTSILAVVLQDSFGPLNRLNVAYFAVHGFIIHFAVRYTYEKKIEAKKVMSGALASAGQMGFCCAAFYIARRVEGVPGSVVRAFFYTTVAMSGAMHASLFFLLMLVSGKFTLRLLRIMFRITSFVAYFFRVPIPDVPLD